MHGGAAEHAVALAGLRLDGVERDGSDHGQAHAARAGYRAAAMRAIRISEWGGPEVLELVEDPPVPEPGDGQVLIRVARAGMNFADTHARENSYLAPHELPLIPGAEVAGVREDTGERVVALVGDAAATPSTSPPTRRPRSRSRTASATPPRSRCCSRA